MAFRAFQKSAFQHNAFQTASRVVSTFILQLPVDYALAEDQIYPTEIGREYEIAPRNIRTTGRTMRSRISRIGGGRPSFKVTSTKRGYD